MRIYLASSWRNAYYDDVHKALTTDGHTVYDWKNHPKTFSWKQINSNWEEWDRDAYIASLSHELAEQGFKADYEALEWCEVGVLLLPSGRSAHLELGYILGMRKPGITLMPSNDYEPELMYKLGETPVKTTAEVLAWLDTL